MANDQKGGYVHIMGGCAVGAEGSDSGEDWTPLLPGSVTTWDAKSAQRGQVLLDAHKVINGERQDVYGSPEDSFKLIADYWNIYLRSKGALKALNLEASDVALMMTLFKIAREANQHKNDNIVDAAGYLGIYGSMKE